MARIDEIRRFGSGGLTFGSGSSFTPTTPGDPEFEERGYRALAQVPSAYAESQLDKNKRKALRSIQAYGEVMDKPDLELFSRVGVTGVAETKQDGWFMKILGVLDTPGELARMAIADIAGFDRGSEITGRDYLDSLLQRDDAIKERHEALAKYTKEGRFLFEGDSLLEGFGVEEGLGRKIAGFGLDVVADPLNLVSFGTAGLGKKAATDAVHFAVETAGQRAAKGLIRGGLDDTDVLVRKLYDMAKPTFDNLVDEATGIVGGQVSRDTWEKITRDAAEKAFKDTSEEYLNEALQLVSTKQFKTLKQNFGELIDSSITPYYATGGVKLTVPFVRGGKTGSILSAAESGGARALAADAGKIYGINQRLTFDLGLRTNRLASSPFRKVGEMVENVSPGMRAFRRAVQERKGVEQPFFKAAQEGKGGLAARLDRDVAIYARDTVRVDRQRQGLMAGLRGLRDTVPGHEREVELALGQILNSGQWDPIQFYNAVEEFTGGLVQVTPEITRAAEEAYRAVREVTDYMWGLHKSFDDSLAAIDNYVPRVFDGKFAKWIDNLADTAEGSPELGLDVLEALDEETQIGLQYLRQLIGSVSRKARQGNKAVDANRFLARREVGKVVWSPEMQAGQLAEDGTVVVIENGNTALRELFNSRVGHVDDDYLDRVIRKAANYLFEQGHVKKGIKENAKVLELDLAARMEAYLVQSESSLLAKKWIQGAERAGLITVRKNVIDVGRTTAHLLGNVNEATETLIQNISDLNTLDALDIVDAPRVAMNVAKNWDVALPPFVVGIPKVERIFGQLKGHVEKALKRPGEVLAMQERVMKELTDQGIPEVLASRIASATSDPVLNEARETLIAESAAAGEQILAHVKQALAEGGVYDADAQLKAIRLAQREMARHRRETRQAIRELEEGFKRTFGTVEIDSDEMFDLAYRGPTAGEEGKAGPFFSPLEVLAKKVQTAVDNSFKKSFFEDKPFKATKSGKPGRGILRDGLSPSLIEALDQGTTVDKRLALLGIFEKEKKIEKEMATLTWNWLSEMFDMIDLGDLTDYYEDLDDLVNLLTSKDAGFGMTLPENVMEFVKSATARIAEEQAEVSGLRRILEDQAKELARVEDVADLENLRHKAITEQNKDEWLAERVRRLVAQFPNRDVDQALKDSLERTRAAYDEGAERQAAAASKQAGRVEEYSLEDLPANFADLSEEDMVAAIEQAKAARGAAVEAGERTVGLTAQDVGSAAFYREMFNRAKSWVSEGLYDMDIIEETRRAADQVAIPEKTLRKLIKSEDQARQVLKEFLNNSNYQLRHAGFPVPQSMDDDVFWNEKVLELFVAARMAMLNKGGEQVVDLYGTRAQIYDVINKFREAAQHHHWVEGARALQGNGLEHVSPIHEAMRNMDVGMLAAREGEFRKMLRLIGIDPDGVVFDTAKNKIWYRTGKTTGKQLPLPSLRKVRAEVQQVLRVLEGPTGGKLEDLPSEWLIGVFSDITQHRPELLKGLSPEVRSFFERVVQQGELPPSFSILDELEHFYGELGAVQKGLRSDAAGVRYSVAKAGEMRELWDDFAPKLRAALAGGPTRALRTAWDRNHIRLSRALPKNEYDKLKYLVEWSEAMKSAKIPKSMMNRNLDMWKSSRSWDAAGKKLMRLREVSEELVNAELSRRALLQYDIQAFLDNFADTIRARAGTELSEFSDDVGWSQRKLPEGWRPHLSGDEATEFKAEITRLRQGNNRVLQAFNELATTTDRKRKLAQGFLSPDATEKEVNAWVRATRKRLQDAEWRPLHTEEATLGWMSPQVVGIAGDALDGKVASTWVALHLENMVSNMNALYTPLGIRLFKENMNVALRYWKGAATVARPDFHVRNFISAAWNNQLVDVGAREYAFVNRWPAWLRREMAKSGQTMEQIFGRMPDDVRPVMEALFDSGVLKGSYASTFHIDKTKATGWAKKLGGLVNPLESDEFLPFKAGRVAMESVEDFMRAAAFVRWYDPSNRESMWMAKQMADAVHFDYSNLTDMERAFKKWIPFLVWSRRNIPLQLQAMLERPGIVNRYQHLMTNMDDDNPDMVQNQFPVSKWIGSLAAGTGVVLNEDTPFWTRLIFDPDLPVADLENVFALADGGIGGFPAAAMDFATSLIGPQVTTPFDLMDQAEYRDVLAPVGLQQILQGLHKIGLYDNVDVEGQARVPYTTRSIMETVVPFGTTYTEIAGLSSDPRRTAQLGYDMSDGVDMGERIRGAALRLGRGLGIKAQTPADTASQTYDSATKMQRILDDLEFQGKIPPGS